MMTIFLGNKLIMWASVLTILVLSPLSETLAATKDSKPFAVFINEGRADVQIDVVSEDKKDKAILPLRPGTIEGALFSGGHVELHTSSKNMVSGRLLFTRLLPTPMSAPEFMEKGTRTFYFRVADGKIVLVKPTDLTLKERKWLKERTAAGW